MVQREGVVIVSGQAMLLELLNDLYSDPTLSDEEFAIRDSELGEMEQRLMAAGILTLAQINEIEENWAA